MVDKRIKLEVFPRENREMVGISMGPEELRELKIIIEESGTKNERLQALASLLPNKEAVVIWQDSESSSAKIVGERKSVLPPDESGLMANDLALCWKIAAKLTNNHVRRNIYLSRPELINEIATLTSLEEEDVENWFDTMAEQAGRAMVMNPRERVRGEEDDQVGFWWDAMSYRNYTGKEDPQRSKDETYMSAIWLVANLTDEVVANELKLAVEKVTKKTLYKRKER